MLVVITLAYNNPKILKESIDRYYEMCSKKPDYHVVLNNHYPLHVEEQKEVFDYIAKEHGCLVFDAGSNLGIIKGIQYLFNELNKITPIKDDDIGMFYDSNAYPMTKNFDVALTNIMNSRIAISVLTEVAHDYTGTPVMTQNDFDYYEDTIEKNNLICISYKNYFTFKDYLFIRSDGYLEINTKKLKEKLAENSQIMAHLCDYKENSLHFVFKEDSKYSEYKNFLVATEPAENISFEKYLTFKDRYVFLQLNKNIKLWSGIKVFER